jgi:hypothetical protein
VNVDEYLVRATPFGFSGASLVGVGDEIALNAGYGKLSTTDAVGRFVDAPADKAGITLRQLLTHTSVLRCTAGTTTSRPAATKPLRGCWRSQFHPGSDFAYSNAGYSLLAAVVELVSGSAGELTTGRRSRRRIRPGI